MRRLTAIAATALGALAAAAPAAPADVFNGRIAFTSFRVDHDPGPGVVRSGDILTMTPYGDDVRVLTEDPKYDAQIDWAPDGTAIAYRMTKPGTSSQYEVARMTAHGEDHRRLTFSPGSQSSSQPGWMPDMSALLLRRSGGGVVAEIFRMGPFGDPAPSQLAAEPIPGAQWYPTMAPDQSRMLFATTSPVDAGDRGIFTSAPDGTDVRTLLDGHGSYDSAPSYSPDGRRIVFESDGDHTGGNPERDMEIFVMDADGTGVRQLTANTLHDEGPAWSPDGTLLVYTSGPDNFNGDLHVMTAAGRHLRRLTAQDGRDESPDWQPIPAPAADRRCGDGDGGDGRTGVLDVRAAGDGLSCERAHALAARWAEGGDERVGGFRAQATDFGGTWRVVLTHQGNRAGGTGNDKLVAFVHQPTSG